MRNSLVVKDLQFRQLALSVWQDPHMASAVTLYERASMTRSAWASLFTPVHHTKTSMEPKATAIFHTAQPKGHASPWRPRLAEECSSLQAPLPTCPLNISKSAHAKPESLFNTCSSIYPKLQSLWVLSLLLAFNENLLLCLEDTHPGDHSSTRTLHLHTYALCSLPTAGNSSKLRMLACRD